MTSGCRSGSPDEVDKPQTWKGKYLSPDLYDKSPESGIFYRKPSTIKQVGSRK